MFTKFLSFPVFMCSLVVGVLFVYLSTPPPTIIYVYPTPEEHSRNGSDNYTCTYVHTESKDLVVDIGLTHYKTIRPDKENPTLIYEALMQIIDINTKPFNSDCSTLANEKLVKIAEENDLPNVTEYRSKVENSKRKKNKKKNKY